MPSSGMQYEQRKLQRSVIEMRRSLTRRSNGSISGLAVETGTGTGLRMLFPAYPAIPNLRITLSGNLPWPSPQRVDINHGTWLDEHTPTPTSRSERCGGETT